MERAARDPAIDALRVGALLVCVAAHASVPYLLQPVPELLWAVRAPERTWLADLIFWWGRAAQPQLFFFIAGVLAARTLAARGGRAFVAGRLTRIGVPLLAGVVFVLPAVGLVWAWGWIETGRATWIEVRSWRFVDPFIARNALGPAHLWFLQDLLVFCLALGLWRAIAGPRTSLGGRRGMWSRWALVALSGTVLVGRPETLFAAPNTFVPDLFRLAFGGTFFVAGLWSADAPERPRRWQSALLLAGGTAAALVLAALLAQPSRMAAGRVALPIAATAVSWLSVLGAWGTAHACVPSLPATLQRLASSSYAIYVLHLPIVGAAQVLLHHRAVPAAFAIVLVSVAGLAGTWALVNVGVRVRNAVSGATGLPRAVPSRAWIAAAVLAGVALRLTHYLRNPDVWHDEAALLVNVLERGYAELLTPLIYREAAPPLFMWAERWIALNVDDSTWALRLLPLLASCAALVVLMPAARVVRSGFAPAAALLMACSPSLLWHSVEAKPYALDVLLAAAAASAFVLTERWSLARRAALFALAAPVYVWLSYPGAFVMGGVAVALVVSRWKAATVAPEDQTRLDAMADRINRVAPTLGQAAAHAAPWSARWSTAAALAMLCLVIAASIAPLIAGPIRAQRSPEIVAHWQWAFPAALDPLALGAWLVRSLIGIADYCFRPFGGVLLLPIAAGISSFARGGRLALAALLTAPIGLAALAGAAGQYPFSGTRLMVFALPALAVLAAEGIGVLLARVPSRAVLLRATIVAVALAPPLVLCGRELVSPSERLPTAAVSRFVLERRGSTELVAANAREYRYYLRDLGSAFVDVHERQIPRGERRLWCIIHGPTPEVRRAYLAALAGPDYAIVQATEWAGATVFLLGG